MPAHILVLLIFANYRECSDGVVVTEAILRCRPMNNSYSNQTVILRWAVLRFLNRSTYRSPSTKVIGAVVRTVLKNLLVCEQTSGCSFLKKELKIISSIM